MTAHDFTYWLQGFAELSGDNPPTKAQWKSIREHLALVFEKKTPPLQQVGIPNANDLLRGQLQCASGVAQSHRNAQSYC